jgi:hypothetical protein
MSGKPGCLVTFSDAYGTTAATSGGPTSGYAHFMGADIAAALSANGWPCAALAFGLDLELKTILEGPPPPFVVCFNLIPHMKEDTVPRSGEPAGQVYVYHYVQGALRVPVICVMLDHVAHRLPAFLQYGPGIEGIAFATLEPNSIPYLERIGVARERIACLPWGGPPPDPAPAPLAGRALDLIFHGSLGELESEEAFAARLAAGDTPEPVVRAILRAADRVVAEEVEMDQALARALRDEGVDLSAFNVVQSTYALIQLDQRARVIRRERFLSAFADLPVHFFGKYPEPFKRKFSRAEFHELKAFGEMIGIIRRAKISLCETINWRHNVHLRATYAMAYGGLVVAERNERLGGDFTDMENIVFTTHPHRDAAAKVGAVLADPALAQRLADAARPIYEQRYTWRETVKVLAPFLPPPVLPQ